MSEPTTMDVFHTPIQIIEEYDHVHHTDGSCYKDGDRGPCTPPIPDELTPHSAS